MTSHSSPSKLDRYDVILEDAIAACNGDVHGALRALMLVNERLETELAELRTAMETGTSVDSRRAVPALKTGNHGCVGC